MGFLPAQVNAVTLTLSAPTIAAQTTALLSRPRVKRVASFTALGVGAGLTCKAVSEHRARASPAAPTAPAHHAHASSFKLPALALDALAGAVGEIAQIALLYPLDTLKVNCQAQGVGAGAVLAQYRAMGLSRGLLAKLYAGCGPATFCSAFVGAVYLCSFYAAKRVGTQVDAAAAQRRRAQPASPTRRAAPAPAFASMSVAPLAVAAREAHECESVCSPSCRGGPSGCALLDPACGAAAAAERTGGECSSSASACGEGGCKPAVATFSAVVSSLCTSLFEAPVELIKHRIQAGAAHGNLFGHLGAALCGGQLGAAVYAPFLMKAIPYDVAELVTYSQLSQQRGALPLLRSLPQEVTDMLIGATAGATAAVLSMPADCIKTHMDLNPVAGRPGVAVTSRRFLATGRAMVTRGGAGALFVGLAPRLIDTVPSTMIYWLAVEACRRQLAPYVATASADLAHA